jgi:tetratricopeptide (TPR) repeat protein
VFLIALASLGAFCTLELVPMSRNDFSREYIALGMVELERGNPDEAIRNFKQADSIRPEHPNLGLYLARALWMKGEQLEAVSHLRTVLRSNPESFPAMLTLGVFYNELGQRDSSLSYGLRSIQRKPYSPVGYTTVAQTLLRAKEFARAESVLVAGQKACGEDFLYGQYLLAGIHLSRGEITRAEQLYRSLLKAAGRKAQPRYEPEFAFSEVGRVGLNEWQLRGKILYGLANVFAAQGALDSAVTNLRAATQSFPEQADAWADLGVSLMATGRSGEAIVALERAISLDSSNFLYWFNKGAALSNEDRLEDAESAYARSLSLNPNFSLTKERLRELHRKRGF